MSQGLRNAGQACPLHLFPDDGCVDLSKSVLGNPATDSTTDAPCSVMTTQSCGRNQRLCSRTKGSRKREPSDAEDKHRKTPFDSSHPVHNWDHTWLSLFFYQDEKRRKFKEHLFRMKRETAIVNGDVINRISILAPAMRATAKHIRQTARDRPGDPPSATCTVFWSISQRTLPKLRTIIIIDPSGVVTDDLRPGQPAFGFDVHDRGYFRPHKTGAPPGIPFPLNPK